VTSTIDPHSLLRDYMAQHGLKASRQREIIADVFFTAQGHLTVDELLQRVRKVDARVSQATVYRAMRLLTDCGLAEPRNFSDGQTRYELAHGHEDHHDHLICTRCGQIVEFVDDRIEALQSKVAQSHGFSVTHHKMELYGICATCAKSDGA